jgi:hypothetical protein
MEHRVNQVLQVHRDLKAMLESRDWQDHRAIQVPVGNRDHRDRLVRVVILDLLGSPVLLDSQGQLVQLDLQDSRVRREMLVPRD